MNGPQLLVLAAGLGRRFGGDKQIAEVGPAGEWLLDYSLYDARQAGFAEAVLVVRPDLTDLLDRPFPLPVKWVFQETPGTEWGRTRPWGTAHAVWSARDALDRPFAVVNADDYYGRESFFQLARFLRDQAGPRQYALVGFPLEKTLSPAGPVSRALCRVDRHGRLQRLEEWTRLERSASGIGRRLDGGGWQPAPDGALVSMNCWAFHPDFLDLLDRHVPAFVQAHAGDLQAEIFLPDLVGRSLQEQQASIRLLPAESRWLGITYSGDLSVARKQIAAWVEAGIYPADLTDPPVPPEVWQAYFPEAIPEKTRRLTGGHIHRTYRVEMRAAPGNQTVVFQRLHPQIFPEPELLVANAEVVAGHLSAKGYPRRILHHLPASGGRRVVWDERGFPWRGFPWFDGKSKSVPESETDVRRAAAALGEWHTFLRDLDPGRVRAPIPGFFDPAHRWRQWEQAVAGSLPDRRRRAGEEIERLLAGYGLVEQYENLRRSAALPDRVLHGDPKISNFLFDEQTGEVSALLDWDTLQPGWIVFDFGDLVRAYASPAAEDEPDPEKVFLHPPYLHAIETGFLRETEAWLTPPEREHLRLGAHWVIWMQALRFLADYLTGDHYFQTQYPEHNLVRARNQLKLGEGLKGLKG